MPDTLPHVPIHEESRALLARAIHDAHLMLSYAAENGIALDESHVRTLVESENLLGADHEAGSTELQDRLVHFWTTYDEVVRAMSPVTPASLAASLETSGRGGGWIGKLLDQWLGPQNRTRAHASIAKYSWISLLVLFFLLAVQVYWVIGSRLEAQSTQLIAQSEELSKQAGLLKKTDPTGEGIESQQLEASGEQLNLELQIRVEALNGWNYVWKSLIPDSPDTPGGTGARKAIDTEESPFTALRKAKLEASLAKESIELYLLPLLYGLLGACLYVLRTLAAEIRAKTFTLDRGYGMRIYTGGLAGLIIAWFGIPKGPEDSLASLTPFALALLAGYSVELLFSFMDRLVTAFTGKQPP